jgi:amino acid permease
MFLVSDEHLRPYAPPVQIIMLAVALFVCCFVLYYTFWEEFYKILFTEEPRVPSDYAGFLLAVACIIVIIMTAYRLLDRIAKEVGRKG